jgi:hypothetical protein
MFANSSPYRIVKYDGVTGREIWNRTIPNDGRESPIDFAIDASNGVVATARSNNGYHTVKYRAGDGEVVWERSFRGGRYLGDEPTDILVLPDGDVIVTGRSIDDTGRSSYATHRYRGSDGTTVWSISIGGSDQTPLLASDLQGDIYFTASTDAGTYLSKLSGADAHVAWERLIDPIIWPGAATMAVDSSGYVVISGQSWNGKNDEPASLEPGAKSNNDFYTIKCRGTDGSTIWESVYDFETEEVPHSVAIDGRGDVVVAGTGGMRYGYENATSVQGLFLEGQERHLLGALHLVKYDGLSGAVIWRKTADFNDTDECMRRGSPGSTAMALNGDGDPMVIWTMSLCTIAARYPGAAAAVPSADGWLLGVTRQAISLFNPLYTAVLKGRIYAGGDTTKVWIEYGETSQYGEQTEPSLVTARWGPLDVVQYTAEVDIRKNNHFRVVVENSQGLGFSGDRTFTVDSQR